MFEISNVVALMEPVVKKMKDERGKKGREREKAANAEMEGSPVLLSQSGQPNAPANFLPSSSSPPRLSLYFSSLASLFLSFCIFNCHLAFHIFGVHLGRSANSIRSLSSTLVSQAPSRSHFKGSFKTTLITIR